VKVSGKSLTAAIYRTSLLTVTMVLILSLVSAALLFRGFTYRREAEQLVERLRLIQSSFTASLPAPEEEDIRTIDRMSKEIGRREGLRLTLIGTDGIVVGDSYFDPRTLVNHAGRAEVREALKGEVGTSTRYSDSADQRMLYVAVPLVAAERIVGVLRASVPASSLNAELRRLWLRGLPFFLGAGCLGAALLWISVRRDSQAWRDLSRQVQSLAEGDLGRRMVEPGWAETGKIAAVLNSMVLRLHERIHNAERQQSQERAILASMAEAVLAVDSERRVINMNEAAATLLAVPVAEARGRRMEEVVRIGGILSFVERAFTSGEPIVENLQIYEEGERHLRAHGTRLLDAAGEEVGALVVLHDVTRLHRLEVVRKDFAANVSHELKTPITSIKGFVETLLEGKLSDRAKLRRFLAIISQQTERLNAIVDDLLSLARLEQSIERREIVLERQVLRPVLESAAAACARAAEKGEIALRVDCPPDLQGALNPQLLEQAVVNLVDNAIKYSDPGGEVRIAAFPVGPEVEISVQDRGCGIEARHLPRLFERFYRVDKARSRALGGTGLGLAIVKHIAISHGGRVAVESRPGEGSTFTIRFPEDQPKRPDM
jgi:two-component system phosphate regulon sensor histidine kinase PhoR